MNKLGRSLMQNKSPPPPKGRPTHTLARTLVCLPAPRAHRRPDPAPLAHTGHGPRGRPACRRMGGCASGLAARPGRGGRRPLLRRRRTRSRRGPLLPATRDPAPGPRLLERRARLGNGGRAGRDAARHARPALALARRRLDLRGRPARARRDAAPRNAQDPQRGRLRRRARGARGTHGGAAHPDGPQQPRRPAAGAAAGHGRRPAPRLAAPLHLPHRLSPILRLRPAHRRALSLPSCPREPAQPAAGPETHRRRPGVLPRRA